MWSCAIQHVQFGRTMTLKARIYFYDMHLYYIIWCCALYYVIIKETQKREEYITRRIYIYIRTFSEYDESVCASLYVCACVFKKEIYINGSTKYYYIFILIYVRIYIYYKHLPLYHIRKLKPFKLTFRTYYKSKKKFL